MASNNSASPISLITLQESLITSCTYINAFVLPEYTLVYDLAPLYNFGEVALYVHNSFSFSRLPLESKLLCL